MGRNKLEKQLKEQLQQREIAPSKSAWERISHELDVSKPPKATNYYWYAIAAGFIGVAFISVLYLTKVEVYPDSIQITNVKVDSNTANPAMETNKDKIIKKETLVLDGMAQEDKSTQSDIKRSANKINNNAFASSKIEETKVEKIPVKVQSSKELIDAKIAEIVARVSVLENRNDTVTEAEIDSLLREAQREILNGKIFKKNASVDATALLADVEDELDQSFRDRIFDALKDGFVKVRTAVADRDR
ncbi:hypothetical protein LCGC14_2606780 [marine sediment metagenome]|uniref:Uncharacterized protein n=2 Tax=root TaxID=1 RepID=A0A831VX17_9FLAO|nr:hypothetical protein [Pricia antarctica]